MIRPARNNRILKRRVDDYLWRAPGMPMVRLRELLDEHFLVFDRIAIVGGLVRDLARYGRRGFRSDVDLVIHAPRVSVEQLAERLGAKANRFGGFAFHHPHWKIDFWALETTWAAQEGHANVSSLSDITQCTFFDCDGILYDLNNRKIITDDYYFERLSKNTIDVQLAPNPSVDGNLLRAIRRLLIWGSRPGDRLCAFIEENLTDSSLMRISAVEARLYASRVLHEFQDVDRLKAHIFDPALRPKIDTGFGEQWRLPGM